MRVALFVPWLDYGGRDIWTISLALGLPKTGIEVAGVGVWQNHLNSDFALRLANGGCKVSVGLDPCVELARETDLWILSGRPEALERLEPRGPVVFVAHGQCDGAKAAAAYATSIVTHWLAVAHNATAAIPPGVPFQVLHNGIDLDRCQYRRSRKEVRDSWGVSDEERVVAYVGRIHPEKNPLAVVRAVRELGAGYRAVIYNSERPEVQEPYLAECREIDPQVVHHPPVMDVGEVYLGADCLMAASVRECCSLTVIEAWACGLPVVSTPVGALRELEEIAGGRLAIRVPMDPSPKDLAQAVREATDYCYGDMVPRAFNLARTKLTASAMCERWAGYLREITPCKSNSISHTAAI